MVFIPNSKLLNYQTVESCQKDISKSKAPPMQAEPVPWNLICSRQARLSASVHMRDLGSDMLRCPHPPPGLQRSGCSPESSPASSGQKHQTGTSKLPVTVERSPANRVTTFFFGLHNTYKTSGLPPRRKE